MAHTDIEREPEREEIKGTSKTKTKKQKKEF